MICIHISKHILLTFHDRYNDKRSFYNYDDDSSLSKVYTEVLGSCKTFVNWVISKSKEISDTVYNVSNSYKMVYLV